MKALKRILSQRSPIKSQEDDNSRISSISHDIDLPKRSLNEAIHPVSKIRDPQPEQVPLPAELWEEIFLFATVIPGKDEFSTAGEAYFPMPCDPPRRLPAFTDKERAWAKKTRISILLVCKKWYFIGLPLLWMNISLDFARSHQQSELMLQKLHSHPEFASRVTRLEVISGLEDDPDYYRRYSRRARIPSNLPSLKILVCSIIMDNIPSSVQPEVLILHRHEKDIVMRLPIPKFWQNVRVLYISFGHQFWAPHQSTQLHFPRLTSLHIQHNGGTLSDRIANHWHTPSLRLLSVHARGLTENHWLNFLDRCSGTLEKLELNVQVERWSAGRFPTPILRRLHTFYVGNICDKWFYLIKAPRVCYAGVFGPMQVPWKLSSSLDPVEDFIAMFPSVQEVSLYGFKGIEGVVRKSVVERVYAREWIQKGVRVNFRLPQPAPCTI